MSNPATTCRNGHPVAADAAFCSVCGAPVDRWNPPVSQADTAREPYTPVGPSVSYEPAHGAVPDAYDVTSPPYPTTGQTAWGPPVTDPFNPSVGPPAVGPPTPSARKRRTGLVLVLVGGGVLAVVAVVLVLVLVVFATPKTTVTGDFVLSDYESASAGCFGTNGYDDISQGTSVVLKNQDGKILGAGALGAGVADTGSGTCTYEFSISDVREDESQYAIEVSHRGQVVNSRAELKAHGWRFAITLGN